MIAVRASTSGSSPNLSAQTGANTAMTAFSELVLANFSAAFWLMKPKPYESRNIPTTTPPTPVHREGFTTSQLIFIGLLLLFEIKYCTPPNRGEQDDRDFTFVDHSANEYTYPAWVSPFRRQNPRQEPGALVAHARICAGGGWQRTSLP